MSDKKPPTYNPGRPNLPHAPYHQPDRGPQPRPEPSKSPPPPDTRPGKH